MCLQRIALWLLRDYYRSVEALLHDVDLMRVNCSTYNDPTADIVHTATQLVQEFHDCCSSSKDSIDYHQESDELRRPVRSTRAASSGLIPELVGKSRYEVKHILPDNLPQVIHRIIDWLSEIDVLQMFSEPVAEDFHDYHMEIRHPQDYSTMRQEIDQGKYTTVQKFGAELQLVHANALKFNEEGDEYWMLAAQSFQQAAPLLQIAQDKFQTAVSIDLPATPSPMPVDVHQFVEKQIRPANIGNPESSSSEDSEHERSNRDRLRRRAASAATRRNPNSRRGRSLTASRSRARNPATSSRQSSRRSSPARSSLTSRPRRAVQRRRLSRRRGRESESESENGDDSSDYEEKVRGRSRRMRISYDEDDVELDPESSDEDDDSIESKLESDDDE